MKGAKNNEYELVIDADFSAFLADFSIKGGYGSLIFVHGGEASGIYISKSVEKKLGKEGLRFFSDRKKVRALIKEGARIGKLAGKTMENGKKEDLRHKTDICLKSLLDAHFKQMEKFLRIYLCTEAFYCGMVDKTIRDFVFKNISDEDAAGRCYALLLNPFLGAKIEQEQKKELDKISAPPNIRTLCESVRCLGRSRLFFRETINRSFIFMKSVLQTVAKRKYLSLNQIEACSLEEVLSLLEGKNIDLGLANRRAKMFAALCRNKKTVFYTENKAKQIIDRVKPEIPKNIKEFLGSSASPGKARGRVVIMPSIFTNNGKDLRKKLKLMKKGDILVANSTGPEMILACNKAAAIVTAEGGINSHAAIIARELGIPGIVGTKIAIRVLRDGDLVEVDACAGIIRVLPPKEKRE